MKHVARDLHRMQLMILAEKAEAHNDDAEARQLRPDKRTVTGTADNGVEFALHCHFSERKAILRSQRCGGEVLRPEHVFPDRYCTVWEHEFEIQPLH